MATNSDEHTYAIGAEGEQRTENGDTEATENEDTDTRATRTIKPDNWSEQMKEDPPTAEQPNNSEKRSKEKLGGTSVADVTRVNDTTEEAPHDSIQPMREAKDMSEDTHPVRRLERSRGNDDAENGQHAPAEADSRHPPADSIRKDISLFVKNVAKHVVEQQLIDLFSKVRDILNMRRALGGSTTGACYELNYTY